jgi:hypothetical protein
MLAKEERRKGGIRPRRGATTVGWKDSEVDTEALLPRKAS